MFLLKTRRRQKIKLLRGMNYLLYYEKSFSLQGLKNFFHEILIMKCKYFIISVVHIVTSLIIHFDHVLSKFFSIEENLFFWQIELFSELSSRNDIKYSLKQLLNSSQLFTNSSYIVYYK